MTALKKFSKAFLRQLTCWHFGSCLHRFFRFISEQILISGSERIWSGFFIPVCFPRVYLWPLTMLEWRVQTNFDCWKVYATHSESESHLNFELNFYYCFHFVEHIWINECFKTKSWVRKIHSWQCIKLRIPSFFLNVTIGGSICIIWLKTIYFNNHIFELNSHPTRLPLPLSFKLAINQAFGNNAYE